MKFSLTQSLDQKTNHDKPLFDCVIVGLFEEAELPKTTADIDSKYGQIISQTINQKVVSAKMGQTFLIPTGSSSIAKCILIVGLGKQESWNHQNREFIIKTIHRTANDHQFGNILYTLTHIEATTGTLKGKPLEQTCLAFRHINYVFNDYKSEDTPKRTLKEVSFYQDEDTHKQDKQEIKHATAIADGMDFMKDLGNTPPNVCTPKYIANQAKKLAETENLECEILKKDEIKKLGMNSFLAVAKGSKQSPFLISLKYNGADKKSKPIVLIGKGISFDTGGISLKPPAAMDEMKYDMCGAASVIGTMKTVARLGLPINVIGVVPTCENMPSGSAMRPGDIVESMSGQTIEILNTDAEGRLILCDALTYVKRHQPSYVIDVATLTGACVIALGHIASGLMSNHEPLAQALLKAGQEIHDRAWELPLWEEYGESLKSKFSDFANIGDRTAGTISAACFLSKFTNDYRWAHLDVAGTAFLGGTKKGATGRPVGLLSQFIINEAEKNKKELKNEFFS